MEIGHMAPIKVTSRDLDCFGETLYFSSFSSSCRNGSLVNAETSDGKYVLLMVGDFEVVGVTTTPAEQAVYDRIERVLDALADSYRHAYGDPPSPMTYPTTPIFAALIEAEFAGEQ